DRPSVFAGAGDSGPRHRYLPRVFQEVRVVGEAWGVLWFPGDLAQSRAAQPGGSRGPEVHRGRDLSRWAQPAARGTRRGGESILGDRRTQDPAAGLRQDDGRMAASAAGERE